MVAKLMERFIVALASAIQSTKLRSKTYNLKALWCWASFTHYPNGERTVVFAVQVAVNQMNLRDNDQQRKH